MVSRKHEATNHSRRSSMVIGLPPEIQCSEESRYGHRLHGVRLVAQGMTCSGVGRMPASARIGEVACFFAGLAALRDLLGLESQASSRLEVFDVTQSR